MNIYIEQLYYHIQDGESNSGSSDFALGDCSPLLISCLPCSWTHQCQGPAWSWLVPRWSLLWQGCVDYDDSYEGDGYREEAMQQRMITMASVLLLWGKSQRIFWKLFAQMRAPKVSQKADNNLFQSFITETALIRWVVNEYKLWLNLAKHLPKQCWLGHQICTQFFDWTSWNYLFIDISLKCSAIVFLKAKKLLSLKTLCMANLSIS